MITSSIVTYKTNKQDLTNLLTCVESSIIDKVYVIDNSPTDELKCFEKFSSKVIYIYGHGNKGFGAGHNIAMLEAIKQKSTYHIVLNPDIIFEPKTIYVLHEFMENNSDIGQVMPKIYYPNGDVQHVAKLLPSPSDLLLKRFGSKKAYQKRSEIFQLKFTQYRTQMDVPFLSGCFMFLRLDTLKKSGLFDERFFMYGEDIDLSRRIHKVSRTVFYPDVSVIHEHAAGSYKNIKMLRIHIVSIIRYFNKWGWWFDKERKKINKRILHTLGNNH